MYHVSTVEEVQEVHKDALKLDAGTLVEVYAGDDDTWYGEIDAYNGDEPLVTYLEADDNGVFSFQHETYEAPKESIN
eukprot:2393851-Pleurochrysis_carterae.AAC.1